MRYPLAKRLSALGAGNILVACCTVAYSANSDVVLDVNLMLHTVDKYVDDWEDERRVSIDTRTAQLVAAEIEHFREIFGYEYQGPKGRIPRQSVVVLLEDEERVRSIVFSYLDDASSSTQLTTIMDRFAREIGASSKNAGWPSVNANQYKSVNFGSQLAQGKYFLESDGKRDHRSSNALQFISLPGNHRIVSAANPRDVWRFSVEGDGGI